ncbi:MAG: methyltransferase domain-containing protein [Acidobacteriota bacterium]|nr:methyltransferase domain-containing protein [Acidobacteriota bacterium]
MKKALIAPFLAQRIWNRQAFEIDLVRCTSCGFSFYNPRLEDSELARLYSGYRLNEYFEARHSNEPWYTSKMNAGLASPESYTHRRKLLAEILRPHLAGRKIRKVLDHGGDRGDLVASLIDGAEAYVFDISGVKPADGVLSVSDPSQCEADLTINSNVLEHVGFPVSVGRSIFRSVREGSLVFLEVPCENPAALSRIARRVAQIGLLAILRPSKFLRLLSPKALYLMHEHINYFTLSSLEKLTQICGGRIIASGLYSSSGAGGTADIGWTLSERGSSAMPATEY